MKLGIGLAPWWGRSAPKFLKAVDSHACNKYHTKKSHVGPWVCEEFSYEEGSFLLWTPIHLKCQNVLTLVNEVSVELCDVDVWHIC